MPKETRRDASKLGTGSRRRHNARKIAIGGARLDSRLRDFRPATKSAENRERVLNGRVSVFVFCPPPPSPRTRTPPVNEGGLSSLLSFHLSTAGERETQRDERVYSSSRLPFIHSIFLHALCLLYTLARATVFCVAQRPNNDGGTLCKLFNVPPFHPSSLLPSQDLRKFNAIPFAHFLYLSPSLSHLLFFFLHHLTFNYTFDVIYFYIYYNIYLTYLFTF